MLIAGWITMVILLSGVQIKGTDTRYYYHVIIMINKYVEGSIRNDQYISVFLLQISEN